MTWDVIQSLLFMAIAVWLGVDAIKYYNNKELNNDYPWYRYVRLPGAIMLFLIGVLYLLDTLGLLHGE